MIVLHFLAANARASLHGVSGAEHCSAVTGIDSYAIFCSCSPREGLELTRTMMFELERLKNYESWQLGRCGDSPAQTSGQGENEKRSQIRARTATSNEAGNGSRVEYEAVH
jgi:hypothetical protein